jgi:hypothetical protein
MMIRKVSIQRRAGGDAWRRWRTTLRCVVVTVVAAAVMVLIAPGMQSPAAAAGPRPGFQLPFPCGQPWRLDSWGHAPALDMVLEPQSGTEGALLVAPADGVVNQSFRHGNAGNMIQINHGGDWFSTSIHLQSRAVQVGDRVTQGQAIGRVGKDGPTSNGVPHLHFEIAIDTNGDGRASWGAANTERVRPWFNGVEYGQANGQTWRNVRSNNCGQTPPSVDGDDGVRTSGDFNGDGREDLAAFYGYGDGSSALWTFIANADGGFAAPVRSWSTGPGNFVLANFKLASGDYNGDGRDDLTTFYGYADSSAALWTFTANTDGGFAAPVRSWSTGPGNFYLANFKLA